MTRANIPWTLAVVTLALLSVLGVSPLSFGSNGEEPACTEPGERQEKSCAPSRPDSAHPAAVVARRFSPILWFSSDERVLPSIPHALAFDGVDNNCNGLIDLADPWEIGWGESDMEASMTNSERVEKIMKDYLALDELSQPCAPTYGHGEAPNRWRPPVRVVYSGPHSLKAKPLEKANTPIETVEYWFYYFFDQGVGAHAHDAEHAFVFLDSKGQRTGGEWGSRDVKGVVGAGHSSHTANNILVTERAENLSPERVLPLELPQHIPIRVELGKHASAPDRNFDGRFDFGMDANVFRDAAWGSRDMQTANQGQISVGPFQSWFSFPTDPQHLYLEDGYFDDPNNGEYEPFVGDSKLAGLRRESNAYTLFPMEDMEYLKYLLRTHRASAPEGEILSEIAKLEILDFLSEHRLCFWASATAFEHAAGKGSETPRTGDGTFEAMLSWLKPIPERQHRDIWLHADHKNPNDVFKLHLYPRTAIGYMRRPESGLETRSVLLLQVADVRVWDWVPFLGGYRFFNDSSLEFGWEVHKTYRDIDVTFKNYRGGYGGFYVGLGWRTEDLPAGTKYSPDELRERIEEHGLSESVEQLLARERQVSTHVGIDLGIALSFNLRGFILEPRVGIRIEPFKDEPTPTERAFGAKSELRYQLGFAVLWGGWPNLRPKHPLTY